LKSDLNVQRTTTNENSELSGTINLYRSAERLLTAIANNPTITYDKLSELLGIPRKTVSRDIKKLQDSGLIEREGAKKNGKIPRNVIKRKTR
jgi:DNA-binding Lrp family transcriptional regulator